MNNIDPTIREKLNRFLTEVLNDILRVEENSPLDRPEDLSVKEIRVLDAVASAAKGGLPGRASEIAALLHVAPGTLTAAADLLQKKNYLSRIRDKGDKRSVRISLTESGEAARQQHLAFHNELTEEILASLSPQSANALVQALDAIHSFFLKKGTTGMPAKILADSTCDLSPEQAEALGVTLIPMSILFEDQSFQQGVDFTPAEFYEKMGASRTPPTTVQLTPYDLESVYREATADGSEAVALHLSSALSGTFQSAVLAAREVKGMHVVDSQNATFGSALLVRTAVRLRDEGKSAAEIAETISALAKRVRLYAYVSTLKYLVRGGRLSTAAGLVGTALHIYPIITVQDGAVKNIAKAKGRDTGCREILRLVSEAGIDPAYGIVWGHACEPQGLEGLKAVLEPLTRDCDADEYLVGPVVGTHTGPGAVGLAFIAKE